MKRCVMILLFAFMQIFSCFNMYASDNILRLYKAASKNDIVKYQKIRVLINESGMLKYYIGDRLLVDWADKAINIIVTGDTTGIGYCNWWYGYNIRLVDIDVRPYIIELKNNIDSIARK